MPIAKFNAVIHQPNRLQICALLVPLKDAEFQLLRDELGLSDSALSKHLKQLVREGYVEMRKSTINTRQRTWIGLTEDGRAAFAAHIEELKRLSSLVR